MGLHSKSGEIDWDEARRQGDVPGRAGAMRTEVYACSRRCNNVQTDPYKCATCGGPVAKLGTIEPVSPGVQVSLPLDTTAPPVKRGLDPRNPDDEAWDERYYGAHSDGGD